MFEFEIIYLLILIDIFIGIGIKCLSVQPYSISRIKKVISEINFKIAEKIAKKVLAMQTFEEKKITLIKSRILPVLNANPRYLIRKCNRNSLTKAVKYRFNIFKSL